MPKQTSFQQAIAASSGPYSGNYLWSNGANWTNGLPVNGDTVISNATGLDDYASLNLASLQDNGFLFVVGASLVIQSLSGTSNSFVEADSSDSGAPVTVTVATLTGAGGEYEAAGAGSVFINRSATDAGENYVAIGGLVELAAAPAAASTFFFSAGGTVALQSPGTTIAAALQNLGQGDVLELPGTSVSNASFGTSSLTVTTNAGTYAFSNVGYSGGGAITGYTATTDSATGLEAITFTGPDTFSDVVETANFQALWSNAGNWSAGVPANGGSATTAALGYDDIAALSLASLTLSSGAQVVVTGQSLTVTQATVAGGTYIQAGGSASGAVTVTLNAVTGNAAVFGADGVGDRLIDLAATDPGETYYVEQGGLVELAAAPSGASTLDYDPTGTFALKNPGVTNAVTITNLGQTDVLELPGTSVSRVILGSHSLSITTNAGTYSFSNVSYATNGAVTDSSAAFDNSTGLMAITFLGPDTFDQTMAATSGTLSGKYLWSNAANWSTGVPANGAAAATAVLGYDDIASLSLATLNLASGGNVQVSGSSLTVSTLQGGSGSVIAAAPTTPSAAVTVTLGNVTGTGGIYAANGASASLIDQATVDQGETYEVQSGGTLELSAAPAAASTLDYLGQGSFALPAANVSNAVTLENIQQGDVLELPGSSVSNVTFGSNSLSVTTSSGTYAFSNVTYGTGAVTGYTAAMDASTGLEAITFTGPDVFQDGASQVGGPLGGKYLWSNAANWSNGVPVNGGSVTANVIGYDDIASLSLSSLGMNGGGVLATGGSLSIGTVSEANNSELFAYSSLTGTPVTVTVGAINGTSQNYGAIGAGARLVDQAASDPGENYFAQVGGVIEMTAAPSNSSTLEFFNGGVYALHAPAAVTSAALVNVDQNDVVEVPGTVLISTSFGANGFSITTDSGTYSFNNVSYASGFTPTGGSGSQDATTGLEAVTIACFCAGTRIGTADGDVAVEQVEIGDLVRTVSGTLRPVRWVGRWEVDVAAHPTPHAVDPVRIAADAVAPGQPHRDLYLSPEHAVYIDGALVTAGDLVDGGAITQMRRENVTYFHIALDSHDVILANGLPCETLLEPERSIFAGLPFLAQFETPCAPRISQGPRLAAIRRMIGARRVKEPA